MKIKKFTEFVNEAFTVNAQKYMKQIFGKKLTKYTLKKRTYYIGEDDKIVISVIKNKSGKEIIYIAKTCWSALKAITRLAYPEIAEQFIMWIEANLGITGIVKEDPQTTREQQLSLKIVREKEPNLEGEVIKINENLDDTDADLEWLDSLGFTHSVEFDIDWTGDPGFGMENEEELTTKWSTKINGEVIKVLSVSGLVDDYQDDLIFKLSNGDVIEFRAYFQSHPRDRETKVTFEIKGYATIDIDGNEFSEKIGDWGSILLPVLKYYEKYRNMD